MTVRNKFLRGLEKMSGKLGIIALESAQNAGREIDNILKEWRGCDEEFLIPAECPRFGSGEAKGIIKESVRDLDLYILVDVCNSSVEYTMAGAKNRMSPDDHYQDLKRVIAACNGRAARITVVMPFLYESRQHRRNARESLDCALMLRELENATCVVSDCVVVDEELSVISDSFYKVNGTRFGRFYNTVCKNGYLGCCMAFRRELISKALPIPDEIATHDGWFGNVAAYFYTVKFIDDKLILFRRHPGNNSTTASASKNGLFKRLGFRWDIIKNIRKLKRSK